MRFPSNFQYQMMNLQKFRVLLYLCIILIIINGIALGATDCDVIVGFKNKPGPSEQALIHSHGGIAKKSFHLIPAIAARVPENEIKEIKKDPRVAFIEDDKIFDAADEYTDSWGMQHIGSDMVHVQGITGTGIKIAVLDTGIDYNHEDLKGNYKGGIGFVQNSDGSVNPSNYDDSTNSHGTHVSGIIAAEKNGIGIVGVAPNASIYAVKVLDGAGFGLASWIISGLQWAVDNNMDIATMSIKGSDSIALHEAVDNAYNSGVLLVAAGGNTIGGSVQYPAAYDSVIAVSATDANDQIASFSAIGPEIELAAPGVRILSTVKGGYDLMDGTSMATPYVAGVAALIISSGLVEDLNGDLAVNNIDVRELLHNAKDLGDPGRDYEYGYGMVDAQRAVLGIANITITRTNGPLSNDVKRVDLSEGTYSVTIHNNDLSNLYMEVSLNGVIRKDLSFRFKFNKSSDISFDLNVENTFEIVFIPYGSKGSTAYATIEKN
jgi:subtilisin